MPLSRHYGGHGAEVMRKMKRRYGSKAGERIFYATEAKRKKRSSARDELARHRVKHKQSKRRHRRRR